LRGRYGAFSTCEIEEQKFARVLVSKLTGLARCHKIGGKIATTDLNMARTLTADIAPSPGHLKQMATFLGLRSLTSDAELVGLVERRLPLQTLDALRTAGITDDELFALVLPRRTLTHRRSRKEPLSHDESDRVVRLARIAALGEAVFGDRDKAWRWLRAPKRQLQGRTPLALLATETGARIVEEWLYRIDDGLTA